jgi:hypothetical protein
MIPWSVWSAAAVDRIGRRFREQGRKTFWRERQIFALLVVLAGIYGLGFWVVAPWLDRRGIEWAFYERLGRQLPAGEPIVMLYDDWDRDPYPTPFGPIPHDVGVRLYYLNRPVCWHFSTGILPASAESTCHQASLMSRDSSVIILGRQRHMQALEAAGRVEVLDYGPQIRWDRAYMAARVWPKTDEAATRSQLWQSLAERTR